MSVPPGSITFHVEKNALHVRMRGEIDVNLRPQARAALDEVGRRRMPVVVDLTGVHLLGATGIDLLVGCHVLCARAGVPCELRRVPQRVEGVLDALGLAAVLGTRVPEHS